MQSRLQFDTCTITSVSAQLLREHVTLLLCVYYKIIHPQLGPAVHSVLTTQQLGSSS